MEMPTPVNRVPGVYGKVPPMIGGAMPLLNPRWNAGVLNCNDNAQLIVKYN